MARTKGDQSKKAGGKAPRKMSILNPTSKTISKKTGRPKHLNPAVRRPIPKWQNPITEFFPKEDLALEINNEIEVINLSDESNPPSGSTQSAASSIDQPGCSFTKNVGGCSVDSSDGTSDDSSDGTSDEDSVAQVVKKIKLDNKNSSGETDFHSGNSSCSEEERLLEQD